MKGLRPNLIDNKFITISNGDDKINNDIILSKLKSFINLFNI